VIDVQTPRQALDAYEAHVLTRAELFSRLFVMVTAENAEEVRRDLGRMVPAFESWIELAEHGSDVALAGRIVPNYVMKRVIIIWRALPPHA